MKLWLKLVFHKCSEKKNFTIVTPEQIFVDIIGVTSFIVLFSFETKIMYQVISKSNSFVVTLL